MIETLKTLVHARGFTAAQVALAWVLHKGEDIVPIPGTTQVQRLEEGIAAAAIQLAPADIAAIEAAVPENAVQGRRYDAASECWEDRERA